MKNIWVFRGKSQKNGPLAQKWQDRKSKRTRQKNKRRDRKGELNDSPKIPDKREISDIPSLPSGIMRTTALLKQFILKWIFSMFWFRFFKFRNNLKVPSFFSWRNAFERIWPISSSASQITPFLRSVWISSPFNFSSWTRIVFLSPWIELEQHA